MQATQKFFVGLQDVGQGGLITNKALIEALSNAANVHGLMVGQSTGDKDISHLSWVVLNWKMEVYQRPSACDIFEVVTWGQSYKGLQAGRDYDVLDSDGGIIAKATSRWVAIDPDTGRPLKLTPDVFGVFGAEPDHLNFPGFSFTKNPPELPLVSSMPFRITKSMIDMNGHVHNASYLDLATEVMPEGVDQILFNDCEVCYRKEIKPGNQILLEYYSDGTTHCVIIKDDNDGTVHSFIIMK